MCCCCVLVVLSCVVAGVKLCCWEFVLAVQAVMP